MITAKENGTSIMTSEGDEVDVRRRWVSGEMRWMVLGMR